MQPEKLRTLVDELLVLEALAGSREAFRALAERWQERLWRQARNVMQRDDLAWDVSQDAWLVIVERLQLLADPRRFGSWALSIVTRRALDRMRREARSGSLEDPAGVYAAGVGDGVDVERVRAALALLPAEQRALLALHHVEGLSLDELAASMEVPVGTVKSRLYSAREALRARLEGMNR